MIKNNIKNKLKVILFNFTIINKATLKKGTLFAKKENTTPNLPYLPFLYSLIVYSNFI